jgi:quercetin dioxygenase-like cupin family protein
VARAHLGMEVVEYEIEAGFRPEAWFEHGGTDFLYVLRGKVLVELGDGRAERVGSGDALEYPGNVPHRWSAVGRRPVKLLLVGIAH